MRPKNQKSFLKKTALLPVALGLFSFLISSVAVAAGINPEDVVKLMNRSRTENNLPALSYNAKLAAAAKAKADDMIQNDYFAHTSPKGVAPWEWMKQSGYQYKYAGENLAINFTNAKEEHAAWMKSQTHRDNILNQKYTEVGVAVVTGKIDGETSVVTVQMFGMPAAAAVGTPKAITPVLVSAPVPTVQGMETAVPVSPAPVVEMIENEFIMPPRADPAIAPLVDLAVDPAVDRRYDYANAAMLIVIGLALIASPAAFLWRTYRDLFSALLARIRPIDPFLTPAHTKV